MPPCVCAILESDNINKPIRHQIEQLADDNNILKLYYPQDADVIQRICTDKNIQKQFLFIDINDSTLFDIHYIRKLFYGFAHILNMTIFANVSNMDVLDPKIQVDSLKFIISDAIGCVVLYDPDPMKLRRLTRLNILLED